MSKTLNIQEIPFLDINDGDNIYDVCSFGICKDIPVVCIDNDNEMAYRLPKEFTQIVKLFLMLPPKLPIRVNFIKDKDEYHLKFVRRIIENGKI